MDSLHNTTLSINETLSKAIKLQGKHGITRLADITNFSRIDLPVWIALRPNAKCLSQSAGKGLTSDSAMLSALMEGIEISYAENVSKNNAVQAKSKIKEINGCECININDYPSRPMIRIAEEISWITIENVSTNQKVYAPVDIFSLDFTKPKCSGISPKKMVTTSNGVASGGNTTEATVSALLEIIERHSITIKMRMKREYTLINLKQFNSQVINIVLKKIEHGGGKIMVFDSTIIKGVYVVEAIIWSDDLSNPICHGSGASLSLEVAILRAILEANQASTIMLSGSRDDMTKSMYTTMNDNEKILEDVKSMIIDTWSPEQKQINFKKITPKEELAEIIKYLNGYNQQPIYRHVFSNPGDPVAAVKVLIPKMEGYHMKGYVAVSDEGKEIEKKSTGKKVGTPGIDLAAGGGV